MRSIYGFFPWNRGESSVRERIGETGLLSDDTRSIVHFGERGKEYHAHNTMSRRVLRYRVDGAIITEGRRCDYAMGLPREAVVYLIELKGKSLREAACQIRATMETLRQRICGYTIHGRVVLRRIQRPDLRASDVMILERTLARSGGSFKRECLSMTEDI